MRSAVVLPQPEGPIRATISPSCTVKLTRFSARTVWTAWSTRTVKCFATSMRLTSPMRYFPARASAWSCTRCVDHGRDVEGLGNIAQRHELGLHVGEFCRRDRHVRIDRVALHRPVIDIARTRIVRFAVGERRGQRQRLGAMAEGIAQRRDIGGLEGDRLWSPRGQRLARDHRAQAQIVGHRLLRRHQEPHPLARRDGLEFARHHRGLGDAGDHGFVAIGIVAEIGEMHVGDGDMVLRQHGAGEDVGQAAGCGNRDGLALEILDRPDVGADEERVRKPRPGQPMIFTSAPREAARMAEPGLAS